jgi:hypothetical protein
LLAAAGTASAEDEHGLYLGAGLGDYSAEIDDLGDIDFDAGDNASKILAGWRFNRFVAVQAEYTDFGDSTQTAGPLAFTANTKGLTPSVVGTLPVGPIELFGKAGVIFYDFEVDTPGNGRLIDTSGEDLVLGVGIGATLFNGGCFVKFHRLNRIRGMSRRAGSDPAHLFGPRQVVETPQSKRAQKTFGRRVQKRTAQIFAASIDTH